MWLTNTQAAATLHSIHERVCLRSLPKSRTFLSTTTFLYVIHDGPFFMNPSHQLDSSGRFRQSMNTKMSFGLFFNRTFAFGHRHLFWITVTITHRTFFRTLLCIFIDICFFVLLPSLRVVTVLVFRSLSCFLSHVLDILHNSSHPWTNRICICKPTFSLSDYHLSSLSTSFHKASNRTYIVMYRVYSIIKYIFIDLLPVYFPGPRRLERHLKPTPST